MRCPALLLTSLVVGALASPPVTARADSLRDPAGIVTLEAPGSWKEREDKSFWHAMTSFDGRLEVAGENVWAQIFLQRRVQFSRAALALELPYLTTDEVLLPDERRTGEGFAELASRPRKDGNDRGWLEWRRGVEAGGIVYVVTVLVGSLDVDGARAAVRPILDSVRAEEGADTAVPAVREGWWSREEAGFLVVSDARHKARALAIARRAGAAREVLAKALTEQTGHEPYLVTTPVIWAFTDSTSYQTFVEKGGGNARLPAEYVRDARVVAVELAREEPDDTKGGVYWDVIRRQIAYQYVTEYFGGVTPTWLSLGLSYYGAIGAESGGRPDKPRTWYVEKGRGAAASARPLRELLPLRWEQVDDVDETAYEMWAWHSFLRHCRLRAYEPARAAYDRYIGELRSSGSPLLAAEAFRDVLAGDDDRLLTGLRGFSKRWR